MSAKFSIRIPADVREAVNRLARERKVSRARVIIHALRQQMSREAAK